MKVGLIASVLIHVVGLAIAPSGDPDRKADEAASATAAASCRCDYEMTITDTQPPRNLTLGTPPAHLAP
jgi:hypothetical protein